MLWKKKSKQSPPQKNLLIHRIILCFVRAHKILKQWKPEVFLFVNLSSEDCQVVLIRRSAGCFVCLFEQYELESTVHSVTEAQNCPSWVPRGRDLQIVSFVSVLSLSGAEPVYQRSGGCLFLAARHPSPGKMPPPSACGVSHGSGVTPLSQPHASRGVQLFRCISLWETVPLATAGEAKLALSADSGLIQLETWKQNGKVTIVQIGLQPRLHVRITWEAWQQTNNTSGAGDPSQAKSIRISGGWAPRGDQGWKLFRWNERKEQSADPSFSLLIK